MAEEVKSAELCLLEARVFATVDAVLKQIEFVWGCLGVSVENEYCDSYILDTTGSYFEDIENRLLSLTETVTFPGYLPTSKLLQKKGERS